MNAFVKIHSMGDMKMARACVYHERSLHINYTNKTARLADVLPAVSED